MRDSRFGLVVVLVVGSVGCGDDGVKKLPDAPKPIDAAVAIDAPPDAFVPDAYVLDGPVAMPVGTHHRYIVEKQYVATNNSEARAQGLDLNGDAAVDNQLGSVFAAIDAQGFALGGPVDRDVDRGVSNILVDLQTTDLTSATDAGITTYDGANPTPPACTGPTDMVCRHHFTGTATFDIAAPGVHEIPLVGDFVGGVMSSSSGRLHTPIALLSDTFSLIGGRIQVATVTATAMSGIIGGCVLKEDIDGKIIPRLQQTITAAIARDCTMLGNPPTCGCLDGSSGKSMLSLFDMDQNCAVTVQEVHDNQLIASLLAPDLRIGGQDCLSIGVKFDAVGAVFTP